MMSKLSKQKQKMSIEAKSTLKVSTMGMGLWSTKTDQSMRVNGQTARGKGTKATSETPNLGPNIRENLIQMQFMVKESLKKLTDPSI
jgi:Na+-transporting NADH:ubiquinone oxidoreductase subunit NqrC